MKVRTVTVGFCGSGEWDKFRDGMRDGMKVGGMIRSRLEADGWEVQEVRLMTDGVGSWISGLDLKVVEEELKALGVESFSFGKARKVEDLEFARKVLEASEMFSCSVALESKEDVFEDLPTEENAMRIAEFISKLTWLQGFNFCVSARCPDGIPFFPSASHGLPESDGFSVAVATENSDVLVEVSKSSKGLVSFCDGLRAKMDSLLLKMERSVEETISTAVKASGYKATYVGIDPSWNPSLEKNESIVVAFENVLGHKFGDRGTLAVAAAMTSALRSTSVKKVGYQGLMLPVMEDFYLAERVMEGKVGISDILEFCSVCGVGLDTIPISTNATSEDIYRTIVDVGALANRWKKPLSMRLLRIEGHPGDKVDLNDWRLCPAAILSIDS